MTTSYDRQQMAESLEQEREFLLRSIDDLEREHAAGDVNDEDFQSLYSSYVQRAAETLRALELMASDDAEVPSSPRPGGRWQALRGRLGRPRTRRTFVIVAIVCVVGLVAITAAHFAGVRLPGQTATGSISLPNATQVQNELTQAQILASSGNLREALVEYNAVLAKVPAQPEALAYRGWLERLTGIAKDSPSVVQAGDASIDQAINAAPGYSDARAFEVIVLLEDDHAISEARSEYSAFLKTKPSLALRSAIDPQMASAFQDAKVTVPASLQPYVGSESSG